MLGNHITVMCSSYPKSKQRELKDGVEILRLKNSWSFPLQVLKHYMQTERGNYDAVIEEIIGGQRLPFFCTLYVKEPLFAVWYQKNTKVFFEQYSLPIAVVLSLLENFLASLYKRRTIISLSQDAKKKLLQLGLKPENTEVVYAGISTEFNHVEPNFQKEDTIVCLGKMRRYKRIDHALLAFARAFQVSKRKTWKLVIAGKVSEIDKSYSDELYELAKKLGIAKQVEFAFNMPEAKKIELLKKAKILLQPSPVEGFSIVVVEANRCGTPVVASDGVPMDVAKNGYNGFVYPFGDIEAMADRIVDLMENEDLWRAISANSREWSKRFTWSKSVANLNNIIERSCSKQSSESRPKSLGK